MAEVAGHRLGTDDSIARQLLEDLSRREHDG
jgi:hypothetical protein